MTQLVSTELFTRLNTDWFNSCVRNVYVRNFAWQANAEEAKKYAALKRQEASDFRVQWVKQEYTKFKEERVFKKSWRRIDATKGKYMSVSQLVADDGGWSDPEAVLGSQRLIEKAVAMGDPWIPSAKGSYALLEADVRVLGALRGELVHVPPRAHSWQRRA